MDKYGRHRVGRVVVTDEQAHDAMPPDADEGRWTHDGATFRVIDVERTRIKGICLLVVVPIPPFPPVDRSVDDAGGARMT